MTINCKRSTLLKLLVFGALVCVAWATPNLSAAQEQKGGPTTIIITYRCAPANRAAFRDSVEKTDIARFEEWKNTGIFGSYRLLFNWYADEDTWDMMAILSLRQYADVARWKEIERTSPGGLSPDTLRLAWPTKAYWTALVFHDVAVAAQNDSGKSVFLVIPYDVAVSMDEYTSYVSGYVIPQMKGWMRERVLASYGLYLNRYYAGKPWDSLLVLEYKDLAALGRREEVVAKVRAALAADPKWKAMSDNKKNVRTEKEPTLADELVRH